MIFSFFFLWIGVMWYTRCGCDGRALSLDCETFGEKPRAVCPSFVFFFSVHFFGQRSLCIFFFSLPRLNWIEFVLREKRREERRVWEKKREESGEQCGGERFSAVVMATVDGRPAQYGLTLKQLRELMEVRGREAIEQLNRHGGVQDVCKKLYTSPTEGKSTLFFSLISKAIFFFFLFFIFFFLKKNFILTGFDLKNPIFSLNTFLGKKMGFFYRSSLKVSA